MSRAGPDRVIPRLIAVVRPHLGWIVLAGVGVLLKEIARVSVYVFVGQALDVVVGVSHARLDRLLLIEGALVVGIGVNGFTAVFSMFRASGRSVHDARRTTVEKILAMPVRFFESHRTGDLVSRVNSDCEAMEGFVIFVCQSVVFRTLMLFMTMGFMLYLNWKIAAVNFFLLPLGYFVSGRVTRPLDKKNTALQQALGKVTATASDVVQGAVEMKAFAMEDHLGEAHDRTVDEMLRTQDGIARTNVIIGLANRLSYALPLVVTYGYGAALVLAGGMSPGEMLAMQYVIGSFDMCVDFLFEFFRNLRASTAAGRRLIEVWDAPKELDMGEPGGRVVEEDAAVRIRDVSFSYAGPGGADGATSWAFRDLGLTVNRGESVAIVGRSGCGKTTLLRLIAGFYAPQGGTLHVFGRQPLGALLREVRGDIALVSQDPYLFPVSIGTNIALGRGAELPSADFIVEAARRAGIHDLVSSLAQGYESNVGERGVKLSGGERQRVAIARAFLKDAPLLLLDEPTSALDSATENVVQGSIRELMKGRTTIVVAHRLSTIKYVDRIYVMEKGMIVESGTHEELLAAGGLYRDLYRRQAAEISGGPA